MTLIESIARVGLKYDPLIKAALLTIGGKNWIISPSHSYYFIVRGDTPIEVSWKLYNLPIGKDIRVNGSCVCPKPEGLQITAYDKQTGKKVIAKSNEADYDKIINSSASEDKEWWIKRKSEYIFSDDNSDCNAYIEQYHIDSELGLYIFIEELKKYYESTLIIG